MLACPDCGHILNEERADTDAPNGKVYYHRCNHCGGIWFDHYAINRIGKDEAIRLGGLPTLTGTKFFHGSHKCPHCWLTLKKITAESVGKSHLYTCPHCRGHWISQKDLIDLKNRQESRLQYFKKIARPMPSIYSVLIPIVALGILGALAYISVTSVQQSRESRIRATALINRPVVVPISKKSVIISFSSSEPAKTWVTISGPQRQKPLRIPVSQEYVNLHTITVNGLATQTPYIYTITLETQNNKLTNIEDQFEFMIP